jgi:prolyl-tRNA editing enzyme YbaK/EbsC (Cys-tRNA(Pro) deacylase)
MASGKRRTGRGSGGRGTDLVGRRGGRRADRPVAGRRGSDTSYAACVVLAPTRADVNGVVRRRLGARKASFAPIDDAVRLTGMEYGGITPIGLPAEWPVLIDAAVLTRDVVVIGSGIRGSKLALPAEALAGLPAAEVIDGLAS